MPDHSYYKELAARLVDEAQPKVHTAFGGTLELLNVSFLGNLDYSKAHCIVHHPCGLKYTFDFTLSNPEPETYFILAVNAACMNLVENIIRK